MRASARSTDGRRSIARRSSCSATPARSRTRTRRMSFIVSKPMGDDAAIRRLAAADLRVYKALRDRMLEEYPEAFTSDASTERGRRADDYLPRLGLDRPEGG